MQSRTYADPCPFPISFRDLQGLRPRGAWRPLAWESELPTLGFTCKGLDSLGYKTGRFPGTGARVLEE